MFVSYYRIENRSSCHILEPILCEPPYEMFYRPHLTLTAACRQVSGSPSARWTVVGCVSPRVMPWVQWKQTHKPGPLAPELPCPFPSDHIEFMLCFPWGPAYVPNWTDSFFLIKVIPISYTTVHLQSTKESVTSVSFYYWTQKENESHF